MISDQQIRKVSLLSLFGIWKTEYMCLLGEGDLNEMFTGFILWDKGPHLSCSPLDPESHMAPGTDKLAPGYLFNA